MKLRFNRFKYQIADGIMNIFNHGFMSLASILVTIACLLLMGSALLISVNVNNIIGTLEDENEIVAYVNDSYSEGEARSLEADLRGIGNVTNAIYVSRDKAFTDFKEQYTNSTLLNDLDASILRDRYVLYLEDISLMEDTLDDVSHVEGIAKVTGHLEIAEGFVTLRNVVGAVSIILVAVLLVISLFIMSNTVKLTAFERRQEIAIMKMVGATNSYITWPFVLEGMLLGLFGALAAYIAQWGVYMLVGNKIVANAGLNFLSIVSFSRLCIPLLLLFVVMGIGVGVLGSLMAIKKFLKV